MYRRREALRDLPGTLDSAFTRTLARIHEQVQVSQALIILAWIHHVGPMSLDTLRYALAIEPHHTQFHEDNLPQMKVILDCCLGLVRLDTSQQDSSHAKVTLVHSTLSVFFDSHPAILQESVSIIADVCLTYLLFDQSLGALSSVVNRAWLQLLHITEELSPSKQDKVWRYLKLVNKRMDDQNFSASTQGLPSHALNLADQEVPAYFAGQRSWGQTLLHTACMLGLDNFDTILHRIAEDTTGPEALLINQTDLLGISALGWTLLLPRETDESGELPINPSRQDSYEHNIHRAEQIIRNFPVLDPYQQLWDINALVAILKSGTNYKGSTRIEYFARLPFLFFLSNYSYSPEAAGRCMSLMESHLNFNLWSALQLRSISDHTSNGTAAPAADGLVKQQDQKWVLVTIENDAKTALQRDKDSFYRTAKRKLQIHSSSSNLNNTDTRWPGDSEPEPERDTDMSSDFVRRELVALFKPGTTMPALVAVNWQQGPVSTYLSKWREELS